MSGECLENGYILSRMCKIGIYTGSQVRSDQVKSIKGIFIKPLTNFFLPKFFCARECFVAHVRVYGSYAPLKASFKFRKDPSFR